MGVLKIRFSQNTSGQVFREKRKKGYVDFQLSDFPGTPSLGVFF